MAISVVETASGGADNADLVLTLAAAPADGDLLVAGMSVGYNATVTPPAGWTAVTGSPFGSGVSPDARLAVFWKIASSEGTSFTFARDTGDIAGGMLVASSTSGWEVSAEDQVASFYESADRTSMSTGTTGVTSQADELAVYMVGMSHYAIGSAVSWTNGTADESVYGNAAVYRSYGLAHQILTATGTQESTASWTTAVRAVAAVATFKVSPAPSGSTGTVNVTEQPDTLSAAGTNTSPPVTVQSAAADMTVEAPGGFDRIQVTVRPAAASAGVDAAAAAPTISGTVSGTVAVVEQPDTLTAAGTTLEAYSGTVTVASLFLNAAVVGEAVAPIGGYSEMATTTTLTLSDLIDDTLEALYRTTERPFQTTVGATALDDTSATQLTIADSDDISVSDVLEAGSELMLVTGKTADATPVFTVARGYLGSTAAAHPTGTVLLKNPEWTRMDVEKTLRRWFRSVVSTFLPNVASAFKYRTSGLQYVEMPADTMRVMSVRYMSTITGRIVDLGGWQFEQDLPSNVISTGKALRVPSSVSDYDALLVTYQKPYDWVGVGDESDTISVPYGSEDLPVLYATAYLVGRREISRTEIDKIEEWNRESAAQATVNLRLLSSLWSEYYRRVTEARKLHYVPRHRPYRKMPKLM